MKKILICLLVLTVCLMAGCGESGSRENTSAVTEIILEGAAAQVKGGGAKAEGNVVTISAVGTYSVSGTLDDGQIVVNTGDDAMEVTLILNNASITNLSGPAIHVAQAKDLKLELAPGSTNTVVSGVEAPLGQYSAEASGAAIYAEDDMDIDGSEDARLSVFGYINNGIGCKNDLDIKGGSISVYAVNNGVRGADSVEIKGGSLTVQAGNDGIKSVTADKAGKGYVTVHDGSVSVESIGDGISAETELSVLGGSISIVSGGNPDSESCKGIKANSALSIEGGNISVNSADHAIHCEGGIAIKGGAVSLLSAAGKGISSENDINIQGGEISLNTAEDGVETLGNVIISGGKLNVVSGKDGVQTGAANSGKGDLQMLGGELYVSAAKEAFNVRGGIKAEGGIALALCGENKAAALKGTEWSGVKGREVILSLAGEKLAAVKAEYAFRNIVFFSDKSGTFSLTDGINSIEIN